MGGTRHISDHKSTLLKGLFALGILLMTISFNESYAMGEEKNEPQDTSRKANALIHESSPYLLQHAYNPVDWMPWGDEAFAKAKKEDKLVLVSIGYSSCHWCHVMEHESFENKAVASIMNEHFVCIKVDREERPDVDNIYMTAVQLMTGQGGWPLNCFTLPDGRPVFGGTYFPKNNWMQILNNLQTSYKNDKAKFIEYASQMEEGIQQAEIIDRPAEISAFTREKLDEMMVNWKRSFDKEKGGGNRAPKFPMPNNYEFMMAYAHLFSDEEVMQHVDNTMTKMAMGGIYDQVGGGFARYSTDMDWKVPHFEKMLYDNGQLLSLYAKGYQRTGNELYKDVIVQTIDWAKREMMTKSGSFFSALDADSEGEEGKFYVWDTKEMKQVLGDDFDMAKEYYALGPKSLWEGSHILLRDKTDAEFCEKNLIKPEDLDAKKKALNEKLLAAREKRERPGLDDKSLTSWNALMLIGLVDSYDALGDDEYRELAIRNGKWIVKNMMRENGSMYHTFKAGESKIDGFLDDYSLTIEAFIRLYEMTYHEGWITHAQNLAEYAIDHFYDKKSGMFFYTSDKGENLIARKMELSDNVIPSSNSSMAKALFMLGQLLDKEDYIKKSEQMLANVYDGMEQYGSAYSNWGLLTIMMSQPYYQIAITGDKWKKKRNLMASHYIPNKMLMGGSRGELPLLDGKIKKETTIYVCVNKTCMKPVTTVKEALGQIK